MRLSVLTVMVGILSCSRNAGEFVLLNHAPEAIQNVSVSICEQTFEFANVLPGTSRVGSYQVRGDCGFEVDVQFGDGRKIRLQDGYVSSGLDNAHEIDITSSEVRVTTR